MCLIQDFSTRKQSENQRKCAEKPYTLLALLCKDEAAPYVRTVEDVNGLQPWQPQLRAKTLRNPMSLTNQLLDPRFTSRDPRVNLRVSGKKERKRV